MRYSFVIFLVTASAIHLWLFIRILFRKRKSLIYFLIAILFSLIIALLFFRIDFRRIYRYFSPDYSACSCASINLPKDDYFSVQLPMAKKNFAQFYLKDNSSYDEMVKKGYMVKISSSSGYEIDPLSTSSPYLQNKAYSLLKELGSRFSDELKANGIPHGVFYVHSVSRTIEQQKATAKNNPRTASKSVSVHNYGLAVDLSAVEVSGSCKTGMKCLRNVLRKMREEKKLYLCPESTNLHLTFIPQ